MRRGTCWIGILLGLLVPLTPVGLGLARGQGASTPGPDHEARALFRRVADAYKALDSYSDDGQFVVAMTLGNSPRRDARPLRLTFNRPNKIDLDVGSVRLISDGKTLTTLVRPLKKYTTAPAPATIGIDTFREGPTGPLLFGGPTGAPTFVLLNLLMGTSPDTLLDALGGTLPRRGQRHPDRPSERAGPAPPRRPGDQTALGHRSEDHPVTAGRRPDALDRAIRLDGRCHFDSASRRSLVRLRRSLMASP